MVEEEGMSETMTEEQVGLPHVGDPPCTYQGGPLPPRPLLLLACLPSQAVRGAGPETQQVLSAGGLVLRRGVASKTLPWEAVLLTHTGGWTGT